MWILMCWGDRLSLQGRTAISAVGEHHLVIGGDPLVHRLGVVGRCRCDDRALDELARPPGGLLLRGRLIVSQDSGRSLVFAQTFTTPTRARPVRS